jgi:hypothetical protein
VQWTRGAAGDLFRISLQKDQVEVVGYVPYDEQNHWLVDEAAWRALARTNPDAHARLRVDRYLAETKQRVRTVERTISFARAALIGSVYYWDVAAGQIRRIDDGSGKAVSFMPTPPTAISNDKCIGCHSISTSGRYMAGRMGPADNLGGVFDLTVDLTGDPPVTVWPVLTGNLRWFYSSWSPDDKRLVVAAQTSAQQLTTELRLYDPMAGTRVTVNGTLPAGTMPDWSPDGTRVAYISNPDSWGDRMRRGDLSMFDMTSADTPGAPRLVHAASSLPGGACRQQPSRWGLR